MTFTSFVLSPLPASVKKRIVRRAKRFYIALAPKVFGATFTYDGIISRHACDFMQSKRFLAAWNAACEHERRQGLATQNYWRVYVCCWAVQYAQSLPGDFMDLGVSWGKVPRAAMDYIGFRKLSDRRWWLVDAWEGRNLIEFHSETEKKQLRLLGDEARTYCADVDIVKRYFKDFDNVKIVRAVIPTDLSKITPEKVAYLHIDLNAAGPEVAALEHLWDRIIKGAVILLNSHGVSGGKRAYTRSLLDEFAESKGAEILALPTGQGLIIKA